MKKVILTAFIFALMLVSGCKKENALVPVMPTDIISEAEAEAVIAEDYDIILEHNAVVDMGNNTYKASYISEPVGAGDPVIVEVTYPSESLSGSEIKKLYFKSYDSRVNKRKIEGVGSEAFIAFPTLNILEEGHLIRITAGSGDTREQLDMLLSLGQTAVDNLRSYLNSNDD